MDKKVIISDIDGTLIEAGLSNSCPNSLIDVIRAARTKGTLFSMASGRDYSFMRKFWENITGTPKMADYEAVLYEDVCMELGNGSRYILGGLSKETLDSIKRIELENPYAFQGLVELPGSNFTLRTARVTAEFAKGMKTEGQVRVKLEERYNRIRSLLDSLKSDVNYCSLIDKMSLQMSADAIDFTSKDANKEIAFRKYIQLLASYGVSGRNILVVGDAENDEEMLSLALESENIVGFVGKNKNLERRLKGISLDLIAPSQKGPLGTEEVINSFLS